MCVINVHFRRPSIIFVDVCLALCSENSKSRINVTQLDSDNISRDGTTSWIHPRKSDLIYRFLQNCKRNYVLVCSILLVDKNRALHPMKKLRQCAVTLLKMWASRPGYLLVRCRHGLDVTTSES